VLTLVAASDPALRAALAAAVRQAGHEVLTADDGAAAWLVYQAQRPPLLVVHLDLAPGEGPPAGDARALCRRVHAAAAAAAELAADAPPPSDRAPEGAPGPFVLVALADERMADLEGALAAGADDYFTTPPSPRNVAARLAIAGRRMRDAAAARRAERALLRARWLAGIGETSIALQHEINNPLAALLGHAALLEQGLVEPGEERELLEVVVEQAQRIATVMKRLAALRDPRSVEYLGASRMLDLSRPAPRPPGGAPSAEPGGAG
jgi:DNA-binding response OmpR family regulator